MARMISEVFEAFWAAGVPEDKAKAAAEAMTHEHLVTKLDIVTISACTRKQTSYTCPVYCTCAGVIHEGCQFFRCQKST